LGAAAQLLQTVLRTERVRRTWPGPAVDDLPRDRMYRVRIAAQKPLYHHIALGDPRPLVEQLRGLQKRCEVDDHALTAEPLEMGHGGIEQARIVGVTKKLQLIGTRHAEAERTVR